MIEMFICCKCNEILNHKQVTLLRSGSTWGGNLECFCDECFKEWLAD